ncbi:ASPRV1 [Cordylochernes scorpioides]|uniref:ASPRV1 n=1 Tax=Cordylochernes scorpioides TaxID=51811 RepID=A0ABY6KRK1_9ARAC|nr:ASPRV1 [Cordylochernes scorpioides]
MPGKEEDIQRHPSWKLLFHMYIYSPHQKFRNGRRPQPTVSGSYLPCQRQRDPSTFSGDGNINPGQWLKEYERVSKYNRWDETMKLANVVFYLNGTAGRWFDNNKESLNSWRSFEDAFRGVFGLQEDSARRAEEVLKSRAQKAEESSESYIQEILSLCHQVNPRMEEGEIVAHIIKGISGDPYQVLVAKDIQTVDEILKFCRHLTTVKQRRIDRTKFARLSNVSCVDDSDDLAALIRRIVREEIQKVFSAPEVINPLREVNALEQTVREEVSRALQPTRPQVNVVQQQPRTPYYNIDRPTQPRKTEHWRTYDDKPICFHCGRPRHVVRYCRERRQVFAEARSRNGREGRNVGFSSRPPRYDADDDYVTPQTSMYFYRSSSPHPSRARSPARRQSQSPARRFSRSPKPHNVKN